jgi:hypothetical protein
VLDAFASEHLMRSNLLRAFALTILLSCSCAAQRWEIGGLGGFAWYQNATITSPTGSVEAGFTPKFAMGVDFGENMYKYIGGEVRWMLIFGQPLLRMHGIQANARGYTNLVNYDLLIHTAREEAKIRPFFAAGAGIKVYSATDRINPAQPLREFAVLRRVNQTEPLISVGGGLKYVVHKHVQLRVDFRTYMTPTPDELFRRTLVSTIHGWVYNFVPTAGLSYLFSSRLDP